MKTDRELLELAAKAVEITFRFEGGMSYKILVDSEENYSLAPWNPLTDDGDALRLAVKLSQLDGGVALLLNSRFGSVSFAQCFTNENVVSPEEHMQDNQYAATRRAIVRAAAELGEKL